MVEERFGFKGKTCFCGAKLAGLQVAVTSYRHGTLPQGRCPGCNREMLLDGPPKEFAPAPEPEPVVAEVVEPESARVSKRKAAAKK